MTTTDRMSNLDSRREITDRTGQTVILGNSVGSAALSSIAQIVSSAAGESRASSDAFISTSFLMNAINGSFGIWAVFWSATVTSSLVSSGAAIAASNFNDVAAGLMVWGADAMLLNIRVFSSTQVYTPTAGTAKVVVFCLGGGGGGGGCAAVSSNNSCASGGGAGAMAMGVVTSGFSGITITVGAGGAGGAAGNNTGTNGGATSFGSFVIGGGGFGGPGDSAGGIARASSGAAGGSASGTQSLFGARGQNGQSGVAETVLLSMGGQGGSTQYGSGGNTVTAGSPSSSGGNAATGFGAGGSGAAGANSSSTSVAQAGGAGAAGLCIVYEYNA